MLFDNFVFVSSLVFDFFNFFIPPLSSLVTKWDVGGCQWVVKVTVNDFERDESLGVADSQKFFFESLWWVATPKVWSHRQLSVVLVWPLSDILVISGDSWSRIASNKWWPLHCYFRDTRLLAGSDGEGWKFDNTLLLFSTFFNFFFLKQKWATKCHFYIFIVKIVKMRTEN